VSAPARLGLFSTLTGPGSRDLVTRLARACADGGVPNAEIAFLLVNREAGESADTDEAVRAVEGAFGYPVVRASAVRFEPEARKVARAAGADGERALWAWRDRFYASYADRLPPTELDLLVGDMWIWGPRQCAERRGVNLHPALPGAASGKMWFDVIWDLVAAGAEESGVMLHRVTTDVDEGPVVSYCRYPLRGEGLDALWASLPADPVERAALVAAERSRKRDSEHPLFRALRQKGAAREAPLLLATMRAVADGRLRLTDEGVLDAAGSTIAGGLDLTADVEAVVAGR
jgi:folate-dependent phosphoribosylglycinamide formyltransferase PurN